MITVQEALTIIEGQVKDFGVEEIPLSQTIGRILREDWFADRDLPPYDRVTMDGIALKFEDYEQGIRKLKVVGIAAAGQEQQSLEGNGKCLEVMTGSILPIGTDMVVRYEDIDIKEGFANITEDQKGQGQNIHNKGEDRTKGEKVIPAWTKISPAQVGVGASLGKAQVKVSALPKVMIISTGDELVKIDQQPLPHQIRRSNVYRLETSLHHYGIHADTDHLNDDLPEIRSRIQKYLQEYDVLILSGGVSKGKFDFLPQVMEELKVEKLFHKIKQRPGKPFWFGNFKEQCTIFALPGNPVSSFLCMQRYFTHWLEMSLQNQQPSYPNAILQQEVRFDPDLTYFLEVQLSYSSRGELLATPRIGNGSGDLANLALGEAFIQLPRGKNIFSKGEVYPIIPYR